MEVPKMKNYFERISFIKSVLDSLQIPCAMNELCGGYQLRFPWCEGDVSAHKSTYGNRNGMVESYCFPWDDGDISILTPEEVAIKIIALYNEEMI